MAVRPWQAHISALALSLGILGGLGAEPVLAQDPNAAAQELVEEVRRIRSFADLDYAMRELMWHQSMSILAAYGGYTSYEREDGSSNANDLRRLKNRINWNQESLADFKRALRRDDEMPQDDAVRAEAVVEAFAGFLAAAREVATLLDDGDPDAANIAYRDKSVPISHAIGRELYTLRRAAENRFDGTARSLR